MRGKPRDESASGGVELRGWQLQLQFFHPRLAFRIGGPVAPQPRHAPSRRQLAFMWRMHGLVADGSQFLMAYPNATIFLLADGPPHPVAYVAACRRGGGLWCRKPHRVRSRCVRYRKYFQRDRICSAFRFPGGRRRLSDVVDQGMIFAPSSLAVPASHKGIRTCPNLLPRIFFRSGDGGTENRMSCRG